MITRREELIVRVTKLVARNFQGDFRCAFHFYDTDQDGKITVDELFKLFDDADIGSAWTWNLWARGVMDALDSDHDFRISWDEFSKVFSP